MVYALMCIAWVSGFLCGMLAVGSPRLPARVSIERVKPCQVSENAAPYSDEAAWQLRQRYWRSGEQPEYGLLAVWYPHLYGPDPRGPVS